MAYIRNSDLTQTDIGKFVTRLVEDYSYTNTIHRASQPGTIARVESPSGEEVEFYSLPDARRGLLKELTHARNVLERLMRPENRMPAHFYQHEQEHQLAGTNAGDYTFSYECVWGINPNDPQRRARDV